jgi:hypothetical protein
MNDEESDHQLLKKFIAPRKNQNSKKKMAEIIFIYIIYYILMRQIFQTGK